MSEDTVRTIVLAILGTGGATFIWTAIKAVIAWRESAEGREDKAVMRLEKFEADCREQLAWERAMGAHWHRIAGIYEFALRRNGVEVPRTPQQPKQQSE